MAIDTGRHAGDLTDKFPFKARVTTGQVATSSQKQTHDIVAGIILKLQHGDVVALAGRSYDQTMNINSDLPCTITRLV